MFLNVRMYVVSAFAVLVALSGTVHAGEGAPESSSSPYLLWAAGIGLAVAIILSLVAQSKKVFKGGSGGRGVPTDLCQASPEVSGRIRNLIGTSRVGEEGVEQIAGLFQEELDKQLSEAKQEIDSDYSRKIEEKERELEVVGHELDLAQERCEQARTEKKHTESVVRSIADGLVVVDEKGEVKLANPAALRLLGFEDKQDIVGRALLENIQDQQLVSLLRGSSGDKEREIELASTDDETKRTVRASSAVVEDEHGKTVGMVSVLADITKRKEVEEALAKAREELEKRVKERTEELSAANKELRKEIEERTSAEEALRESHGRLRDTLAQLSKTQEEMIRQERLRVVGQMASGVAHDINNVLQPILGYSDLLLMEAKDLKLKDKVKNYLEEISMAAKDASRVVSRLYEFTHIRDSQESEGTIDMKELLEQCIQLTHPKWSSQAQAEGRTIRFEKDYQDVPPLSGRGSDVREVITNLIFNAVDAMPKGGTITLRTYAEDDRVIVEVSDNGTGMNQEVRDHCLDPFYSTKGNHGAGLGLWMTYWIVRRHKAMMDIESKEGEGTKVTLRFPVLEPSREEEEELADTDMADVGPVTVLLVEDDPRVQRSIVEYIKRSGHEVETSKNGREALDMFDPDVFDVVITDQGMPGLTGSQMAVAVKHRNIDTPVILLTGFGEMSNAPGSRPEGVDLVLQKPVTLEGLKRAIAGVMSGSA